MISLKNELIQRYDSAQIDSDFDKLFQLLYKYITAVPIAPKHSLSEFNKKDLIYFLYEKYVEYSKQAFFNLILGNIELYCAGLRIIIENYVVLANIVNSSDNVWKKFYLRSFSSAIGLLRTNDAIDLERVIFGFENLKDEYNFSGESFSESYFNYDWLSDENNKIKSFKDACHLIDDHIYKDFQLLSNYSHCNSFVFKLSRFDYSLLNYALIHSSYLSKVVELLNLKTSSEYANAEKKLFNYICRLNKSNPFNVLATA